MPAAPAHEQAASVCGDMGMARAVGGGSVVMAMAHVVAVEEVFGHVWSKREAHPTFARRAPIRLLRAARRDSSATTDECENVF